MGGPDARVGRSALISFTTNPAGVPATLDRELQSSRYLTYLLSTAGSRAAIGETVHLVSDAGQWTTRGTRRDGDHPGAGAPGLAVPPAGAPVGAGQHVCAGDPARVPRGQVAGRIDDLSVTGAAIVLEAQLAPPVGSRVTFNLPVAACQGVVRSRRPHTHPLLRVVGTQWTDSGAQVRGCLEREVRRQLGPQVQARVG